MAFVDWIFNKSATITASIDVVNPPIAGNASLLIDMTTSGADTKINATTTDTNVNFPKGFTKGKIRTLFKVIASAATEKTFGLSAMQSQGSIFSSTGSFYVARVTVGTSGFVSKIELMKNISNTGLVGLTTVLGTHTVSISASTVFSLELQWIYDAVELQGTNLIVRLGYATDFSDLGQIITVTDLLNYRSTSVAEGIFGTCPSTGTMKLLVEGTTLYELV